MVAVAGMAVVDTIGMVADEDGVMARPPSADWLLAARSPHKITTAPTDIMADTTLMQQHPIATCNVSA